MYIHLILRMYKQIYEFFIIHIFFNKYIVIKSEIQQRLLLCKLLKQIHTSLPSPAPVSFSLPLVVTFAVFYKIII